MSELMDKMREEVMGSELAKDLDSIDAAAKELAEQATKLAALRKPFDVKVVGKMQRANVTLSYVGHAAVTDRLLSVDPYWNWEPRSWETDGVHAGEPRFIRASAGNPIGLWIKLTVCGVTRLGYGSVVGNAFDPEKQLIGDAIRNAAMRFGVALDLWTKDELESQIEEGPSEAMKDAREHAKKANASPTKAQKAQALTPSELEEAGEVFGAPAGARPVQLRLIDGLPIYRTWESLKDEKIGKKAAASGGGVPSAKLVEFKTWQWASEGSQDGEREEWLKKLIARAKELHKKNPSEPLAVELQAAALAHSAMLDRIAPPPVEDKEAVCPLTPEEV